jgi:hypothetical protein
MDGRSQSLPMTRSTFAGASSNEHWRRMSFAPRLVPQSGAPRVVRGLPSTFPEEMRGELFKVLVAIKR